MAAPASLGRTAEHTAGGLGRGRDGQRGVPDRRSRRGAAPDAGLSFTELPQVCPWWLDDILADGWPAVLAQPATQYDRDFAAWAARQAAVLRARDASGLDWGHLAEEVEDLWTWAAHGRAMLLHACIELCYGGERHEAYLYHWQDAAFDYQHAMLRSAVKDSHSFRTVLADLVPEVYAEERRERMAKATPPLVRDPDDSFPPRRRGRPRGGGAPPRLAGGHRPGCLDARASGRRRRRLPHHP